MNEQISKGWGLQWPIEPTVDKGGIITMADGREINLANRLDVEYLVGINNQHIKGIEWARDGYLRERNELQSKLNGLDWVMQAQQSRTVVTVDTDDEQPTRTWPEVFGRLISVLGMLVFVVLLILAYNHEDVAAIYRCNHPTQSAK